MNITLQEQKSISGEKERLAGKCTERRRAMHENQPMLFDQGSEVLNTHLYRMMPSLAWHAACCSFSRFPCCTTQLFATLLRSPRVSRSPFFF
jgi:hypothetical protein